MHLIGVEGPENDNKCEVRGGSPQKKCPVRTLMNGGDYFTERLCLRTTWPTIIGPKDVVLRVTGQNSKLCLMAIVEKYNLLYYYLCNFINYFIPALSFEC